jgi:hypothetical protein
MRKTLVALIAAFVMLGLTAQGVTPAKKKASAKKGAAKTASTAKKGTANRTATPSKSGTSHSTATSAARRGKKSPSTTWRNRQMAPTADRYKEIQSALASKGYLQPDQATGAWNQASIDALKKFQADQKIESSGKINSLSLIALGLGPKHDTAAAKPPSPPAPDPQPGNGR